VFSGRRWKGKLQTRSYYLPILTQRSVRFTVWKEFSRCKHNYLINRRLTPTQLSILPVRQFFWPVLSMGRNSRRKTSQKGGCGLKFCEKQSAIFPQINKQVILAIGQSYTFIFIPQQATAKGHSLVFLGHKGYQSIFTNLGELQSWSSPKRFPSFSLPFAMRLQRKFHFWSFFLYILGQ
jgi:hypothetical protein